MNQVAQVPEVVKTELSEKLKKVVPGNGKDVNSKDVKPIPKRKKVAILGTVPHKMKAPFSDGECEIWAIAHACLGEPLPRCDRIIEIHKWDEVVKWNSPQAWAMHPHAKLFIQEKRDDTPRGIPFPFDELDEKYQIFDDRKESNMTNSISWMIAMAIEEGFEDIHIYGVNMSHFTEYGTQKPSCEYYLGLAKGMGKKIHVPAESDLMRSNFLYGKDEEKQSKEMVKHHDRLGFLTNAYNGIKQQLEQGRDAMNQHVGAIEERKSMIAELKQ